MYYITNNDYLMHHGVKGQKWGIRRYQNPDGTLTEEGKRKYGKLASKVKNGELLSKNKYGEYHYTRKGAAAVSKKTGQKVSTKDEVDYETIRKIVNNRAIKRQIKRAVEVTAALSLVAAYNIGTAHNKKIADSTVNDRLYDIEVNKLGMGSVTNYDDYDSDYEALKVQRQRTVYGDRGYNQLVKEGRI